MVSIPKKVVEGFPLTVRSSGTGWCFLLILLLVVLDHRSGVCGFVCSFCALGGMAGSSSGVISGGKWAKGPFSKTSDPAKGSWAQIVVGAKSQLPEVKKMNLSFVPPVILAGRPKVVTAAEIAVDGAKRWSSTLVGCFVGGSLPFSAVNNIARKIWTAEGLLDVLTLEKGFFLFRFATETGMRSIMEKGPWLFAGRYMVLRKWRPGLPLS